MNYKLKTVKDRNLENAEKALIQLNPWNCPYEPETAFWGVYVEDRGFYFKLLCKESSPRITYFNPGDEVCEDSCMEIFLNFAPEKSKNYINFEMNAGGAYLFGVGPDRYERKDLASPVMPEIHPQVFADHWEVTLFIPKETVFAVYGDLDLKPGYRFVGNAYKCGDETEIPHFLTWNPVVAAEPDFHRPECFGEFEITE